MIISHDALRVLWYNVVTQAMFTRWEDDSATAAAIEAAAEKLKTLCHTPAK